MNEHLQQVRRRLYVGKPDCLRTKRAPMYRLKQLGALGIEPIDHCIYPTGLSSLMSTELPSLVDIDTEIRDSIPMVSHHDDAKQAGGKVLGIVRSMKLSPTRAYRNDIQESVGLYALALKGQS